MNSDRPNYQAFIGNGIVRLQLDVKINIKAMRGYRGEHQAENATCHQLCAMTLDKNSNQIAQNTRSLYSKTQGKLLHLTIGKGGSLEDKPTQQGEFKFTRHGSVSALIKERLQPIKKTEERLTEANSNRDKMSPTFSFSLRDDVQIFEGHASFMFSEHEFD